MHVYCTSAQVHDSMNSLAMSVPCMGVLIPLFTQIRYLCDIN